MPEGYIFVPAHILEGVMDFLNALDKHPYSFRFTHVEVDSMDELEALAEIDEKWDSIPVKHVETLNRILEEYMTVCTE